MKVILIRWEKKCLVSYNLYLMYLLSWHLSLFDYSHDYMIHLPQVLTMNGTSFCSLYVYVGIMCTLVGSLLPSQTKYQFW